MNISIHLPLVAALLVLLSGCTPRTKEPVVARVGEEEITAAQLQDFAARLPEGLKSGGSPVEVWRKLLESLIDMRLLLMEAKATRVEDDPEFSSQLEGARRSALLDLYQRRQVDDQIAISPEEIERCYRETHRDRALRFSGVMLPTREAALEVIAKLKAGADIHQLAVTSSEHRETGERGGESAGYQFRDQLNPVIAEHIAHLKVGEISDPVPMTYKKKGHYSVFKILDEMPAPLQASEVRIREDLTRQRRATRVETLLDSLNRACAPQFHYDHLALLSQRNQTAGQGQPQLSEAERSLAACTFKGGQITLADLLQTAQEIHFPSRELADSAAVATMLRRTVLPARLFEADARALGLDQDASLLAELEKKRQELLLQALRHREVDQHVQATEEEARAFYDTNPAKFTSPETILATEILVASDTLAQRLKQALQEGADPMQLALKYTQREGALHHQGQIRLNVYTQAFFPGIFEAAQRLEVGQVGGPVRAREGYSVFKVTDKVREREPYNADAQRRATAYVKVDRAKHGYVDYVQGLRGKYRVEIDEELLKGMGPLPGAPTKQ